MIKYAATLVLTIILSLAIAFPANASFCRIYNQQEICILNIQRSAKNYWEYRVVVSINGVLRPREVYNCRDRIKEQKDGTVIPFKPNDVGKLICNMLDK